MFVCECVCVCVCDCMTIALQPGVKMQFYKLVYYNLRVRNLITTCNLHIFLSHDQSHDIVYCLSVDQWSEEYVLFLLDCIENPPEEDEEEQVADAFLNMILSFNQHFKGTEGYMPCMFMYMYPHVFYMYIHVKERT